MNICSIEGCAGQVRSRTWCEKHYTRWLRHGDATTTQRNWHAVRSTTCRVSGCILARHGHGSLCWWHHRHGEDAQRKLRLKSDTPPDVRIALSTRITESGCWEWTRGLNTGGYGMFLINRRPVKAHRFSYEFYVGPIPSGLVIDHLCRVRHCINPAHLEPVTAAENTRRGVASRAADEATDHAGVKS